MSGRVLLAIAAITALATGCPEATAPVGRAPAPDPITTRGKEKMGTYVVISIAAPESAAVLEAIEAGFAEIDRLVLALSEWRADSELEKVNRNAGKGPVAVGPELYELARAAWDLSAASAGAFDATVQTLDGLWDFRWQQPVVPAPAALAVRLRHVGFARVVLDDAARTISITDPETRIGLSGIGKGFVADKVSRVLHARGYANHLVRCSGDIYAAGRKPSGRWTIGIRHPRTPTLWAAVEVENEGISTSGDYERFFIKDGIRYHHLLDPKTGAPARGVAATTVIGPSATLTDGWDTGMFILGAERGLAKAEQLGLDVLFIDEQLQAKATPGMQRRLVAVPPDVPAF